MAHQFHLRGILVLALSLMLGVDAFAQAPSEDSCDDRTTVIFVNGIKTSEPRAQQNRDLVNTVMWGGVPGASRFDYDYYYNPTEDAGADLVESALQSLSLDLIRDPPNVSAWLYAVSPAPAFATDTILQLLAARAATAPPDALVEGLHQRLKTEVLVKRHRVILVPHSQGTLIANGALALLQADAQSAIPHVGIVALAEVDSIVGTSTSPTDEFRYRTGSEDRIIGAVRILKPASRQPLDSNATNGSRLRDQTYGHFLDDYYLVAGSDTWTKFLEDATVVASNIACPTSGPAMNLVTIRIDGTVASHVKDEFDPSAFDTTMPPQLTAGTPFTLTYVIDTNSQDSAFDRRRGRYTGSVKSAEVRIGTWSYIADISASLNSVYCPRADEPCGSNAVEILDNFFAGGPIGFGSRQEDSYRLRIRHQLQTNLYDRIWLEYEFRSTTSMPGPSPTLFHSDVVQQQVPNASSPIFTLSTNRTAPDAFRREEIRGVGSSWTIVSGNMPEVPPIPSRFVSGGKEWRRLDEFAAYFFSASDVRNVCPGDGRCSGSLAGISLDGWTWASDREVAEMLESASGLTLGTLTSLTGTASYLTSDRTYALAAIDKLGFTYSGTNQVGGTGYTRSVDSQTGYAILVGFGTSNPNLGSSVDAFGRSIYPSGQRLDYFVGAYFYRSIAGP